MRTAYRRAVPYLPYLASVAAVVWLLHLMRQRTQPQQSRALLTAWAAAIAVGAVITATVSTGRGTPFGDFDKAYYPAGQLAVADPASLYACGHADGLCFVNLPVVALAFVPFASMAPAAAHLCVAFISVAVVGFVIALLIRLVDAKGWSRFAIASLVLLNGPLYYSLRLGNLTHVVLAMLAAALLAWRNQRRFIAGLLLGICAVLKPPFLLWLPYLALRDRTHKGAVAFLCALGAAVAVSLLWFGVGVNRTWLDAYVAGTASRPVGAYNAQSISGMLIRLTTTAFLVDWSGVDMSALLRGWAVGLEVLVLVAVAGVLWRAGRPASFPAALTEQSLVLCAMLLVSPISWTHYYCWLLVPLAAWVTGQWTAAAPALRAAFWIATLAVSLPVTLWIPGHPWLGPVVARVLLSHYVAGGAMLLGALAAWRIRAVSPTPSAGSERELIRQWNPDAI